MSEARRRRGSFLNVCKECGQELPNPMDRISIVLKKLRKEFGYGEKCKKQ